MFLIWVLSVFLPFFNVFGFALCLFTHEGNYWGYWSHSSLLHTRLIWNVLSWKFAQQFKLWTRLPILLCFLKDTSPFVIFQHRAWIFNAAHPAEKGTPQQVCFSVTKEMRTIHDHIDRNSKTLIYMIHCLGCNKQHIGETKRRLEDSFDEHRRSVDRPTPSSRPTPISDYFLSDNHSPHDIELVPLELIHSSPDALRKAVLLRDKMNLNLEWFSPRAYLRSEQTQILEVEHEKPS